MSVDVIQPEIAAAKAAIRHHLANRAVVDFDDDAGQLALIAVQAARPAMWLRAQKRIDELEDELSAMRASLAGGVCMSCGMRTYSP